MKNILLCVVGLTPQTITETLYVLTQQRGEFVDEIFAITTLKGYEKTRQTLLDPKTGKFWQFCKDFAIDSQKINFSENNIFLLKASDGNTLSDIRFIEDNQVAANQICEIVSQLTKDLNSKLHASVAGGRKSMGILLTAAMQLFGRPQDELSHVLVNEEFETNSEFYYIPPIAQELEVKDFQGNKIKSISTKDARIDLADIPFIRLRGVISSWLNQSGVNYSEFVKKAQEDLDLLQSVNELRLDLQHYTVTVENRSAILTPREFFIYLFFAQLRQKKRKDSFIALSKIAPSDLEKTLQTIFLANSIEYNNSNLEADLRRVLDLKNNDLIIPVKFQFFPKLIKKIEVFSNPKVKSFNKNTDPKKDLSDAWLQPISRIKKEFRRKGIPEKYLITCNRTKEEVLYGLNKTVSAEQIKII